MIPLICLLLTLAIVYPRLRQHLGRVLHAMVHRRDYEQTWLGDDYYQEPDTRQLDALHAIEIERIKEMEVRLFLEVPTATWLDPNRYGDNPDWRPIAPKKKTVVAKRRTPSCVNCGGREHVYATAQHGDQDSAWQCHACLVEFTRADMQRQRDSRYLEPAELRRPSLSDTPLAEVYMHSAPAVIPYRPDRSLRITSRQLDDELISMHQMMQQASEDRLPCGCTGAIKRGREPYTGWWFSACETCGAEWEPPSNDSTGRRLAQGERVIYPPARPMR